LPIELLAFAAEDEKSFGSDTFCLVSFYPNLGVFASLHFAAYWAAVG
jgi:hypothetical protein